MKLEVNIREESKHFVETTFNKYEESTEFPTVFEGRTIIHMYPKADTINEYGEPEGFADSLFFHFDIYNVYTGKVYRKKGYHDELDIQVPCRVRAFKDLSTMIIIDYPIRIDDMLSVMIYEA